MCGLEKVRAEFSLTVLAYNLCRFLGDPATHSDLVPPPGPG
jgi:hypothetical protein